MRSRRNHLSWLVLAAMIATSGCDRESATPEFDEAVLSACYHFDVTGAFEYSATCQDYRVTPSSEMFLRVVLMHPPVAMALEIPRDAAVGQYGIGSPGADDRTVVGGHLLLTPLEGPEDRFDHDVRGTLTLMHLDGESITALFDFEATSATSNTPIAVRGHLRDLPVSVTPQRE
jgi:hypothetical protein